MSHSQQTAHTHATVAKRQNTVAMICHALAGCYQLVFNPRVCAKNAHPNQESGQ